MEVEIVYIEGCPNVGDARASVEEAARRTGIVVHLGYRVVADGAEAVAAGMRGSPTVLVLGTDAAGPGGDASSLSCRLYAGSDGYRGAPDVDLIASALTRATGGPIGAESR